jgi:hypothetical protein
MPVASDFSPPPQQDVQHAGDEFGPPIADAPSPVPPIEDLPEAGADDHSDDFEIFAARRQRLKSHLKEKRRSSR